MSSATALDLGRDVFAADNNDMNNGKDPGNLTSIQGS
jgi:hypothetical protein